MRRMSDPFGGRTTAPPLSCMFSVRVKGYIFLLRVFGLHETDAEAEAGQTRMLRKGILPKLRMSKKPRGV